MGKSSNYDNWTREELIGELEYRDESQGARNRQLERAATLMAETGKIHNTPYAKSEWIAGR